MPYIFLFGLSPPCDLSYFFLANFLTSNVFVVGILSMMLKLMWETHCYD